METTNSLHLCWGDRLCTLEPSAIARFVTVLGCRCTREMPSITIAIRRGELLELGRPWNRGPGRHGHQEDQNNRSRGSTGMESQHREPTLMKQAALYLTGLTYQCPVTLVPMPFTLDWPTCSSAVGLAKVRRDRVLLQSWREGSHHASP